MNGFFSFIERINLTTKLLLGFGMGVLVAAAIGINALLSLSALETSIEKMYEIDVLGVSAIKDANLNLIYMSRAMRHMLIAQDDATRDTALATIKRSREKLMVELAESRKRMINPEVIARYDLLQRDLTKALEGIEQAVGLIQREKLNSSAAAQFITGKEFGSIIAAADGGLHELVDIKEKAAERTLQLARTEALESKRLAVTLLLGGVILAGLVGFLVGRSIQRPNNRLLGSVEELAAGKVDQPIPHVDYPNEIGIMARAIAILQTIYGKSNEQHWVKSHVSEISSALHQAENVTQLAQAAISQIAPVVGAGHGAIYVADSERRFTLLGSYGYRERKSLNNSFMIGEGLIGQAAMEKKAITLTAPQDYIQINSGLGEGPPATVAVLPIIHQDRVLAVLEVASFQQFSEREIALLDALVPALATSMEIMDRNQRTKDLLVASQEQAERMEKQAAQLEEQTVEMEAQQAELLETENWFRSIIEASPDGTLVVDTAGQILLSNPTAERLFGYASGELIGCKVDALVPMSARGPHALQRDEFVAQGRTRLMGNSPNVNGLRKDGSEFAITVSLSPLPARGARGKCVSVSVRASQSGTHG